MVRAPKTHDEGDAAGCAGWALGIKQAQPAEGIGNKRSAQREAGHAEGTCQTETPSGGDTILPKTHGARKPVSPQIQVPQKASFNCLQNRGYNTIRPPWTSMLTDQVILKLKKKQ